MLPPQLPGPAGHLPLALAVTASFAVSCRGRSPRRRRAKPKRIVFPPPPLRRLVSSSLRRLLPRPRPLGGRWPGRRGRRKAPAEDVVLLVLSLALGDRLAVLAEAWRASGLGQALGIWAAVWGRARRRRKTMGGLRRLAALLLGIAFCALASHFRGAAFLEGLRKTGGGRKLARIFLH
ncbi:hypothetical protein D1007_59169 [Hordeum vulgare]|uniref:Predicted protein n=1 Tax=Hordeum vulgare subsp. vulgare TaxID=112509 RepID=F2CZU5_HORVV|nr:uncharacterized protein LOC123429776 [Hordeum vulgare subsp. vulgare]KAE8769260.1 hypothetical protein D1007_59169 [Hordeum vulgare]KAI5012417.1 hypothetical protein ZWY2020_024551 [Hordeum vulgare]BAJ88366.1 predicted protein [Hordeum vulgare subsp. vulgare]BAJ89658.1 predicted protein [Hordeum vulgare subsp. vulgare]